MNNKEEKSNLKYILIGILLVAVIVPVTISFIFYALETEILKNETISIFEVIKIHTQEIIIVTMCLYGLIFYFATKMTRMGKPKNNDNLASMRWSTVKEQKEFFGVAPIDTSKELEVGGCPVAYIDENTLLYEKEAVHSLIVGSTRSGKSRKLVRQLVMLASMAKESMIFNDPKKEMYQDFHIYLTKKGYDVYCIDLRFMQYSDCWNPLDTIIECFSKEDIDDADQYAQDMVTALVVDNGKSEAIWIEGQKALIKGLILANCQANIREEKKNFYSVYQTLALLGAEKAFGSKDNKKMELSVYFDSLSEMDIARTAFTAIKNSPEKTRGSFITTALATLQIFSGIKLMKVLSKSDFRFSDFTEGKKALFVVNPDEKKTTDSVTAICFDQAYQSLVFEANKMPGTKLKKRVHMIFDEFGNMPRIEKFQSKITVALSRGIVYHLYLQDFSQMSETYGENPAQTIRGNCNLWIFISSADLKTLDEISKKIGNKTIWVSGESGNYNQNATSTGTGVSFNQQTRALADANELGAADNRDGDGIIIYRTYFYPSRVNLPDCTQYKWFKEMEFSKGNVVKENNELVYAVPRWFSLSDIDINSTNVFYSNKATSTRRNTAMDSILPAEQNLHWFWSMRNDLSETVRNHVLRWIKEKQSHNEEITRKDINKYLQSEEFFNFLDPIDVVDEKVIEKNSASFEEVNKILNPSMKKEDVYAPYISKLDILFGEQV